MSDLTKKQNDAVTNPTDSDKPESNNPVQNHGKQNTDHQYKKHPQLIKVVSMETDLEALYSQLKKYEERSNEIDVAGLKGFG